MLAFGTSVPGPAQPQRPMGPHREGASLPEQAAWAASWPAQLSACGLKSCGGAGGWGEGWPPPGAAHGCVRPRDAPFFWGVELTPASTQGISEAFWLDSKPPAIFILWFITEILWLNLIPTFVYLLSGQSISTIIPGRPGSQICLLLSGSMRRQSLRAAKSCL